MSDPVIGHAASYGEPWSLALGDTDFRDRGGNYFCVYRKQKERILACVNACAGVPDPQDGELERLRREVSSLRALARTALEPPLGEGPTTDERMAAIIEHLEGALKEIAKEGR